MAKPMPMDWQGWYGSGHARPEILAGGQMRMAARPPSTPEGCTFTKRAAI
ncbi:MAG TPA: hypothetical protein VKT77_07165 [Chthonomonadaceae bacterium]|nr:hypothetical protein [Chthonomonadaceae bacterium]